MWTYLKLLHTGGNNKRIGKDQDKKYKRNRE